MGGTRRLDEKERKFAVYYIETGGNAYQSALRAGYKQTTSKYASQWLNPEEIVGRNLPYKQYLVDHIASERERIMAQVSTKSVITIEQLLQFFTDIVNDDLEGTRHIRIENRMRSAENLAKYLGLEKQKIELNGTINNPFEGLTTEELVKIANGNE